ncbi:MAG TPA: hypothetical protein VGP72_05275 [Planctomycetota bacterium]|jgi:hypothetical protein
MPTVAEVLELLERIVRSKGVHTKEYVQTMRLFEQAVAREMAVAYA